MSDIHPHYFQCSSSSKSYQTDCCKHISKPNLAIHDCDYHNKQQNAKKSVRLNALVIGEGVVDVVLLQSTILIELSLAFLCAVLTLVVVGTLVVLGVSEWNQL